jgi:hypothetical protein
LTLPEEVIELVVRADPSPNDFVSHAFADGAVLFTDPDRPSLTEPFELFES